MLTRAVRVQGLGWWSLPWANWAEAAAALRHDTPPWPTPDTGSALPAPQLLSANERRRAPQTVLMALHAAEAACAAAGVAPDRVPSVFATAHADLAIVDAMCQTLAHNPQLLSPMRFHHSVHNAASGYWAIAARNHQPSTALAAARFSFAAGLLEALAQCSADDQPVLLVASDNEAAGPLRSVHGGRGALAVAMVLAPEPAGPAGTGRALQWRLQPTGDASAVARAAAPVPWLSNPMVAALPLLRALARPQAAPVALPLSDALLLQVEVAPEAPEAPGA